ncbi:hypothetical protein EJB05_03873 [Eragrostis curvula]|uniref:PUB 62/63 C-terminal domain-containing protein n=1 Tax=Eragrostis curvula TaxID=38414 RepID=A0A5J9W6V7_9POAL|nr:hypothetical protein EJB05_03873 [Eragrostis curvula]
MASPPGANREAFSSRGAPSPFPVAGNVPSRAADSFPLQHHFPANSGDEEVEEDEGSMDDTSDDEEEAELEEGTAESSQQRGTSSSPGVGQATSSGYNVERNIQEEQQWQRHSHVYSRGTERYICTSFGGDEPCTAPRELMVENGYGVIGRREGGPASSYWDLLRAHLSDPLTGVLMDDAMILSCGHSYGSSGMEHIYKMVESLWQMGQPITEDSIRPNLALRLAVQAFKREEESTKALKRRRERLEQDKCGSEDPNPTDLSRGKGVQFPFAVFDRVIIKGNKRTPERFVGRLAVVTAQCLNGWYVVKTLDNAESVKLQCRSLAKIADGDGGSAVFSNNALSASWL